MTHVITGGCCNDAACVSACPVNCIHPTPDEPDFATAEMLYIDPQTCIDCGACVDVCPVAAVSSDFDLAPEDAPFLDLNAAWFTVPGRATYPAAPFRLEPLSTARPGPLRVALVGTGPTGGYVGEMLLALRGTEVQLTVIDKLLTPGGLVRFGVAPDHQDTKAAGDGITKIMRRRGVTTRLGVEVGKDVTAAQLLASHHAVVVATGASEGRRLGVPGEDLPGSLSAADLVGWYNAHPDQQDLAVGLLGERAVVIGNGNVALDVARVLAADRTVLERTDIADHALRALSSSSIREITVVARRGAKPAAFTAGELLRLLQVPGVIITTRSEELPTELTGDPVIDHKITVLRSIADRPSEDGKRRIELRFGLVPHAIVGDEAVRAVRFVSGEELPADLVVTAVGYRSSPVGGLPFDEDRAVVPNEGGRVSDVPGCYVAGWIKRGPSGGIGANRWCARETVAALLADYDAGLLAEPTDQSDLPGVDSAAWTTIDQHERSAGRAAKRPRVKLASRAEQLDVIAPTTEHHSAQRSAGTDPPDLAPPMSHHVGKAKP